MENFKQNKNEIGIDEAGRGPFFGPVYAGAVIWGDSPDCELIKDSKKLSSKKRKEAEIWIKNNIKHYGVGFCSSQEIDEIGIINATQVAMERAINNIDTILKDTTLVIDGIGWEQREFNINSNKLKITSVIKGDSKFKNIAAASILAKEAHDRQINEMCINDTELISRYDLINNKGYGTKKHIEGIKKYGLTEFHRQSFNINYN
jgi:ribonuclease HII